jgi:hypothetical protein
MLPKHKVRLEEVVRLQFDNTNGPPIKLECFLSVKISITLV